MYTKKVLNNLKNKLNKDELDSNVFFQAVEEVLNTLNPILTEKHEKNKILERLIVPEQSHQFKVIWERDNGEIEVNNGYRIQFNSTLGAYKGGLRFHPSVTTNVLSFLAFEQTFKNSLTGLPMGGAKGGSDFDPKGKSDKEIMRFCYAFAEKINPYIGDRTDIPAGDIGVGGKEIGYMFGKLKSLRNRNERGILTGKPISLGGSLARKEATGYGVVFFLLKMFEAYKLVDITKINLDDENFKPFTNKTAVVSGSGNVAIYTAEKFIQLGGKVLAMSDSNGVIIDKDGIDVEIIKTIKEVNKERISSYINLSKNKENITYIPLEDTKNNPIWNLKVDIALPCATQNELDLDDVKNLYRNDCNIIVEGANMPTTSQAYEFIKRKGMFFSPGKASNAGGVSTSFLEMSQNASLQKWSFDKVEKEIFNIMSNIFDNCFNTAKKYGDSKNLVMGANIYSFERIVEGMDYQGIIN